jgi:5-methylcytosine-specific restriction endonuclease McrA
MNGQVKTQEWSEYVQSAKVPIGTRNGKVSLRQTVFTCKTCGKGFTSKKACKSRVPVYCSSKCYGESIKKYKTCANCGKIYAKWTRKKYCSKECFHAALKGRQLSSEHKKALSEARRKSPRCKGQNLYNWKGGASTRPERSRIARHNRRVRFINGGVLDPVFLRHLLAAHRGLCFYCERPLTDYRCLEHLTPLSRGGKNQPFNLVYACKSCNSKKRQMSFEDYAITTGRIWLIDKWEDIFIYAYGRTKEALCNTAS